MVAKLLTVPTFDVETFVQAVVKHCEESFDYDVRSNRAMGDFGAEHIVQKGLDSICIFNLRRFL